VGANAVLSSLSGPAHRNSQCHVSLFTSNRTVQKKMIQPLKMRPQVSQFLKPS
jgi:hypothetical protein